jgi:hypothetical protein
MDNTLQQRRTFQGHFPSATHQLPISSPRVAIVRTRAAWVSSSTYTLGGGSWTVQCIHESVSARIQAIGHTSSLLTPIHWANDTLVSYPLG